MQSSIKEYHLKSIFSLWFNWLVATGAVTLLILLDLWVPRVWHPVVAIVLEIILVTYTRRESSKECPPCCLLPHLVGRGLFWIALIMVAINLSYSYGLIHRFFDPELLNEEMSFLTVLIAAPVMTVIGVIAYYRGQSLAYCKACVRRNGVSSERGFVGRTYNQESKFQIRLMVNVYGLLSMIVWTYYGLSYINVNLNSADKFVFIWLPVLGYLIVGLHCGIRYAGVWNYYNQNLEGSSQQRGRYTRVRMLIIWNDSVFLTVPDQRADLSPMERKIDTPCKLQMSYRQRLNSEEGKSIFTNMAHIKDLDIRFMYANTTGNCDFNSFHFLCFPDDKQKAAIDERWPGGVWMKLDELDKLASQGKFSPFLLAELYRLYKVAMAWKRYSPDGHRLYKIKHYRPSFRIRDIKEWEVDYNDPNWLYVSDNNEDVPFWHLREFWRKYVLGIVD